MLCKIRPSASSPKGLWGWTLESRPELETGSPAPCSFPPPPEFVLARLDMPVPRASARLIRVALAVAYLAQVAPNAHATSAATPGQPPSSRLSSSKLARSLSEAGRSLQLRLVERTRGGEVKAEEGAEAEQQDGGEARVEATIDRTRRGFYPRVYEAIPEAEGNG